MFEVDNDTDFISCELCLRIKKLYIVLSIIDNVSLKNEESVLIVINNQSRKKRFLHERPFILKKISQNK